MATDEASNDHSKTVDDTDSKTTDHFSLSNNALDAADAALIKKQLEYLFKYETKNISFNTRTFWEEFFCQNAFSFGWIFSLPLIIMVCGLEGAKNSGFLPGDVLHGSQTSSFISQSVIIWAIFPGMIQFLRVTFDPETESDLDYVFELMFPIVSLVLRNTVISIKYAFQPRGKIIQLRKHGRSHKLHTNEMVILWSTRCLPSAVNVRLRLSQFRQDSHHNNENFVFKNDIDATLLRQLYHDNEVARVDYARPDYVPFEDEAQYYAGRTSTVKVNPGGDSCCITQDGLRKRRRPSILLASHTKPKEASVHSVLLHNLLYTCDKHVITNADMAFAGVMVLMSMSIPPLYRFVYEPEKALFGRTSLDTLALFSCLINACCIVAPNYMFVACATVHFERLYCALNMHLQLLLNNPQKHLGFAKKANIWCESGLDTSQASNIYQWIDARSIIKSFGKNYTARITTFLGMFITVLLVLLITSFIEFVNTKVINSAFISACFQACILAYCCQEAARIGIKVNDLPAYHTKVLLGIQSDMQYEMATNTARLASVSDHLERQKLERQVEAAKLVTQAIHIAVQRLDNEQITGELKVLGIPLTNSTIKSFQAFVFSAAVAAFNMYKYS